jgi:hypothetical protein
MSGERIFERIDNFFDNGFIAHRGAPRPTIRARSFCDKNPSWLIASRFVAKFATDVLLAPS